MVGSPWGYFSTFTESAGQKSGVESVMEYYSKARVTSSESCYLGRIFLYTWPPTSPPVKLFALNLQWADTYGNRLAQGQTNGQGPLTASFFPFYLSPHRFPSPLPNVEGKEEMKRWWSFYIKTWVRIKVTFVHGDSVVCHIPPVGIRQICAGRVREGKQPMKTGCSAVLPTVPSRLPPASYGKHPK